MAEGTRMEKVQSIEIKRNVEKRIVSQMIALYCRKHHSSGDELCEACAELCDYARGRSDHCPVMATKTFCSSCEAPCYHPEMREKIKEVMRFSGPRMIFYHPITAIRHLIVSRKKIG